MVPNALVVAVPNISKNVPYDLLRNLAPMGQVAESIVVIGVNSSVPAMSLRELTTRLRNDLARWARVAKAARIEVD